MSIYNMHTTCDCCDHTLESPAVIKLQRHMQSEVDRLKEENFYLKWVLGVAEINTKGCYSLLLGYVSSLKYFEPSTTQPIEGWDPITNGDLLMNLGLIGKTGQLRVVPAGDGKCYTKELWAPTELGVRLRKYARTIEGWKE